MKKYLFLCEKPSFQTDYENSYNLHKDELDFEADFISDFSMIWHPSDKLRHIENYLEKTDKELLLKLNQYPELPDKFYLLNSSKFYTLTEKIKNLLDVNNYDSIVNAFYYSLESYLSFENICDNVNIKIPRKLLLTSFEDDDIFKNMKDLKDNKDYEKHLIGKWIDEYNDTMKIVNDSLNKEKIVTSKKGIINTSGEKIILFKDESWNIINCDENYLIHISKGNIKTSISIQEFFMYFF